MSRDVLALPRHSASEAPLFLVWQNDKD